MANIKKSFNFRNGVQVDDDNLKVSTTGLVGIGTTVPTEALDVRGNLVVSGVSSAVTAQAGVMTVTTLNPTEIIGAGVSIVSGIVTASSGIITFYGDARFLQGMPTSQWEDTDVGLGVSSIYNTGGNVGIATTAPLFTLQVGNDVNSGQKGVGISSFGDIKASGIVTATTFSGNLSGNIGSNTIVSGITTFSNDIDVDGHADLVSLNVSGSVGIGTTNPTSNLQVDGTSLTLINKVNANNTLITVENTATGNAGVKLKNSNSEFTFLATNHLRIMDENAPGGGTERFTISSSGDVGINSTAPTAKLDVNGNVNIAGVTTLGVTTTSAGSNFFYGNNAFIKDEKFIYMGDDSVFRIGHHAGPGHSQIKHDSAVQDLVLAADRIRIINRAENKGLASFTEGGQVVLNYDGNEKLKTSGIGVTIYNQLDTTNIIASSTITAAEQLNTPICGIGTDAPAHDIQVRKSGDTEIQVTSDTGSAGITVGREPGSGKTNNAEFRYGFSAGSDYNTPQSLDIINYGTDNFNYYLSANNPGGVTGNYYWHKGLNNVRLMTLTNTGRLGIGITAPTDELDVQGGVTVSGNITVGNNVTVSGNIIGNVVGQLTGNVAGTLAGNTNTTVGISTLNNLSIAGIATAARLRANKFAIGDNPNTNLVNIFISDSNKIIVNDVGQIGITTTTFLTGVTINAIMANATFSQIGCGVTQFTSGAVDFSDAGAPVATRRYMMPPKVNTSQRASLVGVESGAIIYNTSLNKLQVYVGSGAYNVANWQNLH